MAGSMTYCISARFVLGVMAFLMFFVTQMIRVNLYFVLASFRSHQIENITEEAQVSWAPSQKECALLLGAFYWTYWITELPGGLLAQKFGGRKILCIAVAVTAVFNLLIPMALRFHYLAVFFLRLFQGLALGASWPAMHWLSGRWIPQSERSKFMVSYKGTAIGIAVTYPLSGLIISHFGWEYVFYFVGGITLLWCFAWWFLVYDSPSSHPRISPNELDYLSKEIGVLATTKKSKNVKTPWRYIFNSHPVWAVMVASQGVQWGSLTLSMQTPFYFNQVHHLNISTNGLLSGIPEVSKFLFALVFSSFIDTIISKKLLSVTAARKLAVVINQYIPGGLLLVLGFYGGENPAVAVVLLTLIACLGGASSSGNLANIVDLSPVHAGTILGLIQTLTIIPGVMSPLITSYLTKDIELGHDAALNWRYVFIFVAVLYFVSCTVYLIFGSGEVQHWNDSSMSSKEEAYFLKWKPPSVNNTASDHQNDVRTTK